MYKNVRPRNRTSKTFSYIHYNQRTVRGVQSNSFYYRVANTWNNLPKYIVTAPSIYIFKHKLDDHWKELPIKFNHKLPRAKFRLRIVLHNYYYNYCVIYIQVCNVR